MVRFWNATTRHSSKTFSVHSIRLYTHILNNRTRISSTWQMSCRLARNQQTNNYICNANYESVRSWQQSWTSWIAFFLFLFLSTELNFALNYYHCWRKISTTAVDWIEIPQYLPLCSENNTRRVLLFIRERSHIHIKQFNSFGTYLWNAVKIPVPTAIVATSWIYT